MPRELVQGAIETHIKAEVARRLAAAPSVETAIDKRDEWLISNAAMGVDARLIGDKEPLRAAIAADRKRAVTEVTEDIAKPLAARMAAEVTTTDAMISYVVAGLRRVGMLNIGPADINCTTRAILVDIIDKHRRVPLECRRKGPTPDEARRLLEQYDDAVSAFHDDIDSTRKALLRALGVEE